MHSLHRLRYEYVHTPAKCKESHSVQIQTHFQTVDAAIWSLPSAFYYYYYYDSFQMEEASLCRSQQPAEQRNLKSNRFFTKESNIETEVHLVQPSIEAALKPSCLPTA